MEKIQDVWKDMGILPKDELQKALEEANSVAIHKNVLMKTKYEHFAELAMKEIEEKDKIISIHLKNLKNTEEWMERNAKLANERQDRIKELELKLDAYLNHNIDRTLEKDKLVNRIHTLEEAINKAIDICPECTARNILTKALEEDK